MPSTAHVTARPRYGVLDVVGLLFRELLLMIVVFLVIFAIGAALAFTLKRTYTATGAVFAGVGQEYVYRPRVGADGQAQGGGTREEAGTMGRQGAVQHTEDYANQAADGNRPANAGGQ